MLAANRLGASSHPWLRLLLLVLFSLLGGLVLLGLTTTSARADVPASGRGPGAPPRSTATALVATARGTRGAPGSSSALGSPGTGTLPVAAAAVGRAAAAAVTQAPSGPSGTPLPVASAGQDSGTPDTVTGANPAYAQGPAPVPAGMTAPRSMPPPGDHARAETSLAPPPPDSGLSVAPSSGDPAADGTTSSAPTAGTATDGTATDGTATDGTATDGTATDGTATDGAATTPGTATATGRTGPTATPTTIAPSGAPVWSGALGQGGTGVGRSQPADGGRAGILNALRHSLRPRPGTAGGPTPGSGRNAGNRPPVGSAAPVLIAPLQHPPAAPAPRPGACASTVAAGGCSRGGGGNAGHRFPVTVQVLPVDPGAPGLAAAAGNAPGGNPTEAFLGLRTRPD